MALRQSRVVGRGAFGLNGSKRGRLEVESLKVERCESRMNWEEHNRADGEVLVRVEGWERFSVAEA